MFIRTKRLFLRPPFPEDWRELHAAIGQRRVVRMLARAPWPYTEEDAQDFCKGKVLAGHANFLITLPNARGSTIVGGMGFGDSSLVAAELGYWIAPAHAGQGYATEAGTAVLQLAETLGYERLLAGHFTDNHASARVLAKLGFVPNGEVRAIACAGRDGAKIPAVRYARELGVKRMAAA